MSASSMIGTLIRASASLPNVDYVRLSMPISGSFRQEQDSSITRIERNWHFARMASGITIAATTTIPPTSCRIHDNATGRAPHRLPFQQPLNNA